MKVESLSSGVCQLALTVLAEVEANLHLTDRLQQRCVLADGQGGGGGSRLALVAVDCTHTQLVTSGSELGQGEAQLLGSAHGLSVGRDGVMENLIDVGGCIFGSEDGIHHP